MIPGAPSSRTIPKSIITTLSSSLINRLAGFKSLWTILSGLLQSKSSPSIRSSRSLETLSSVVKRVLDEVSGDASTRSSIDKKAL